MCGRKIVYVLERDRDRERRRERKRGDREVVVVMLRDGDKIFKGIRGILSTSLAAYSVCRVLIPGPMAKLNLSASVYKVYCVEDHHLVDDGSALATA